MTDNTFITFTDVVEFEKFHRQLTFGRPDYNPYYIKLEEGSKETVSLEELGLETVTIDSTGKITTAGIDEDEQQGQQEQNQLQPCKPKVEGCKDEDKEGSKHTAADELIYELAVMLPDDARKMKVIEHYRNDPTYLLSIVMAMRTIKKGENRACNVVKTTRAGFTTNAIIAALLFNKSIALVEPTNKIATKTVMEAYQKYVEITGDDKKVVRRVLSNNPGCSTIVEMVRGNGEDEEGHEELLELNYLLGGGCENCEIDTYEIGLTIIPDSTCDTCAIKTTQLDRTKPDIVTVTYDKLIVLYEEILGDFRIKRMLHKGIPNLKNNKFRKLIRDTDILLLDETGTFIEKTFVPMTWKGKGKNLVEDAHKVRERLNKAEKPEKVKYLISFMGDFLIPFVDGLSDEIKKLSETWVDRPCAIANPLESMQSMDEPTLDDLENERELGIKVVRDRLKDLDNRIRFVATRHEIENAIMDAKHDKKFGLSKDDVKLIDNAFQLIRADRMAFMKIMNDSGEEIIIAPHNQNKKIETLSFALKRFKNKTVLISDATLPPLSLSKMLGMDVESDMFGDPLNTNDKMLIIHRPLNKNFDMRRWTKGSGEYQIEIAETINELSRRIRNTTGSYPIVWCMSKDVAKQLEWRMHVTGCASEIMNEYNTEIDKVLISHYKSIYSRGVSNSRRVHIALGNAHKPKKSFAGLVLGAPNIWDGVFGDKQIDEIKFFSPKPLDPMYMVLESQQEEFDKLVDAVQMEYTYADAWQAVSRAKDPAGENRSVVICLGWMKPEVMELCQQGEGVNYDFTSGYRFFKDPQYILPRPHISDDIKDMEKWLNGEDIDVDYGYFELGIAQGIYNLYNKNRAVLSHELVYSHFAKHYRLKPDDIHNGFFVGYINLAVLKGILIKTDVGSYLGRYDFSKNENKLTPALAALKIEQEKQLFEDFRTVMHAAYEVEGSMAAIRDIHQKVRRKITAERVKEVLDYVSANDLLKNSDWTINKDDSGGYTITKNNSIEKVLTIVKELSKTEKVIRSWMVQKVLHIPESKVEKIFLILDSQLMFPSTLKFNKYHDKWNNVITVG